MLVDVIMKLLPWSANHTFPYLPQLENTGEWIHLPCRLYCFSIMSLCSKKCRKATTSSFSGWWATCLWAVHAATEERQLMGKKLVLVGHQSWVPVAMSSSPVPVFATPKMLTAGQDNVSGLMWEHLQAVEGHFWAREGGNQWEWIIVVNWDSERWQINFRIS